MLEEIQPDSERLTLISAGKSYLVTIMLDVILPMIAKENLLCSLNAVIHITLCFFATVNLANHEMHCCCLLSEMLPPQPSDLFH
jgi:hypothetical protein